MNFGDLQIQPLTNADLSSDARDAFAELECHLRQGRAGQPWCKWAVEAIDRGIFLVADTRHLGGKEVFSEIIAETATAFKRLCAVARDDGKHYALTVLLRNDVPLQDCENVLHARRSGLLRDGLMAALLHPDSNLDALSRGPQGKPYRCSWPFLTIRWAVPEDTLFVGVNRELRTLLEKWLSATLPTHEKDGVSIE